jgi:DMSO/TMAO reductase YedYZ heme-binding membrane subunit
MVWMALRRSLGMSAAWLGSLHACVALTTYLDGSWPLVVAAPYLRAGLTALLILLALLITSFPTLVRLLHIRFWKQLHRLAYVAVLFLFQHLMQAPFALRWLTVLLFSCLVLLGLVRVLPFVAKWGVAKQSG